MQLIYDLADIDQIVSSIKKMVHHVPIITLKGPLGAGKSTLVRAWLRSEGVTDVITSPTFSYVNHYRTADGRSFFHFDLYRIEHVNQFVDAGFDEYLHIKNATVFIEWPEVIHALLERLPHSTLTLQYSGEQRLLVLEKHETV